MVNERVLSEGYPRGMGVVMYPTRVTGENLRKRGVREVRVSIK
jgi:hypothetical protein